MRLAPVRAAHSGDDGFSLIELFVVMLILGVIAAIAIPRFLAQRETARDAAAINDIRNLATVVTTLTTEDGVGAVSAASADDEGWEPSSEHIRACVTFPSDTVTLTVWNTLGRSYYTWTQQTAVIQGTEQPSQPDDCADASAGTSLID